MKEELLKKRLFLLDMDGTIYLDNDLFDGTTDFLEHIKKIGGKYLFLTNNSSKSVDKYIQKLKSLGIESTPDDFVTSVNATAAYLEKKNYKKMYVFGTESLKEQLSNFSITDKLEDGIDCLVMGFDTELCFQKLEDACILLNRGVDYIATNPDWVCPTWYGSVPDCGSIAQILETATGRTPYFIGKPRPEMIYLSMEKTGYSPDETVIIGDRLYTDIASGVNAGVSSILVLSGEATMDDVEKSDVSPTHILKDIKELYEYLSQNFS